MSKKQTRKKPSDKLKQECRNLGLSIENKGDVFERWDVTYDEWRKCCAAIRKEGQVIVSDQGTIRNPRMTDLHQFEKTLRSLRAELGMAQTKREAVKSEEPDDSNETPRLIYRFGESS